MSPFLVGSLPVRGLSSSCGVPCMGSFSQIGGGSKDLPQVQGR